MNNIFTDLCWLIRLEVGRAGHGMTPRAYLRWQRECEMRRVDAAEAEHYAMLRRMGVPH